MTDDDSSLRSLLGRVLARTRSEQLGWEPVDSRPASFALPVEDDIRLIIESLDQDDLAPYQFSILDATGRRIAYLKSTMDWDDDDSVMDDTLRDLYAAARAQALRVDEVVGRLMQRFATD